MVIDLSLSQSKAQQDLVKRFYKGYIPHVVVLDRQGNAVYNASGEVEESEIAKILDKSLQ